MQTQVPQQIGSEGVIGTFVATTIDWVQGIWNAFWFHPEMFTGNWSIIWWIFFFPVGAAMAVGVIFVLRGVTNF